MAPERKPEDQEVDGKPAAEVEAEAEKPVDPREALASGFAARRNEELAAADEDKPAEEDAGADEDAPDSEPAVEPPAEEAPAAKEDAGASPAPDAEAEAEAEAPKFTIKVNGREQEVTQDQLIAMAQKGEAAEQNFQKANEILAEAKALQKRPAEPETKPAAEAKPDPKSPAVPPQSDDIDAELAALGNDIQMGEPEQTKAALKRLLEIAGDAGKADPVQQESAQDIADTVLNQVDYQQALKTVGDTYPTIWADKFATQAAVNFFGNFTRHRLISNCGFKHEEVAAMTQEDVTTAYARHARKGLVEPLSVAMDGACQATMSKVRLDDPGPKPSKGKSAITVDKSAGVDRKRRVGTPPASKSGRPAAAKTSQPRTPKQIVAGMARSRGQMV